MSNNKPRQVLKAESGGVTRKTHVELDAYSLAQLEYAKAALARLTGYEPSSSIVYRLALREIVAALSESVELFEMGAKKHSGAEEWKTGMFQASYGSSAPAVSVPDANTPEVFPTWSKLLSSRLEPAPNMRVIAQALRVPLPAESIQGSGDE